MNSTISQVTENLIPWMDVRIAVNYLINLNFFRVCDDVVTNSDFTNLYCWQKRSYLAISRMQAIKKFLLTGEFDSCICDWQAWIIYDRNITFRSRELQLPPEILPDVRSKKASVKRKIRRQYFLLKEARREVLSLLAIETTFERFFFVVAKNDIVFHIQQFLDLWTRVRCRCVNRRMSKLISQPHKMEVFDFLIRYRKRPSRIVIENIRVIRRTSRISGLWQYPLFSEPKRKEKIVQKKQCFVRKKKNFTSNKE